MRTLTIDGIEIDIPEDAYIDIKQFSHVGKTEEHVNTLMALPEYFGEAEAKNSGSTAWMTRTYGDDLVEWTVFLT